MHFDLHPETIINTLKNCFKWKNDNTIKASKLTLNIFSDFVKLRVIPKDEKASKTFNEFKKNPNNLKLEGKLETWIEIGLSNGKDIYDDLEKKIDQVNLFHDKHFNEELLEKEEKKKELSDESGNYAEGKDSIDLSDIPKLKDPILVTWDFSKVSENALEHALQFVEIVGGQIYLLNIAKKEKDIFKIENDLKIVVDETYKKSNVKIKTIVKAGNIFRTITEIANENNAKLVIMGTHGVKGMQKFTGSWALKVISGTNTPFVVIHDTPDRDKVKNIAFSIDHTKENKQKLKQAKVLAKNKNVVFHLTVPAEITNPQILKNTKTNLNYVKSYFKQNSIDFEVHFIEGTDSSVEATLKFIKENKTDLIVVLTTKNINIQDYVLGADEQKIISNDSKIPVMCINPNKVKYTSYSTFANS